MQEFDQVIKPFITSIADGAIEIYNEFSLQHELGVFLRNVLPNYRIQFERNVSFFFSDSAPFIKREIDITIFSPDKSDLAFAIELKYPRNGQHPEQMFSFCKDIKFAEQLKTAGFSNAAVLIFADDKLFYQGDGKGIYGFFRTSVPLNGRIQKPTGKKDEEVCIDGTYQVEWYPVRQSLKHTLVPIQ